MTVEEDVKTKCPQKISGYLINQEFFYYDETFIWSCVEQKDTR